MVSLDSKSQYTSDCLLLSVIQETQHILVTSGHPWIFLKYSSLSRENNHQNGHFLVETLLKRLLITVLRQDSFPRASFSSPSHLACHHVMLASLIPADFKLWFRSKQFSSKTLLYLILLAWNMFNVWSAERRRGSPSQLRGVWMYDTPPINFYEINTITTKIASFFRKLLHYFENCFISSKIASLFISCRVFLELNDFCVMFYDFLQLVGLWNNFLSHTKT